MRFAKAIMQTTASIRPTAPAGDVARRQEQENDPAARRQLGQGNGRPAPSRPFPPQARRRSLPMLGVTLRDHASAPANHTLPPAGAPAGPVGTAALPRPGDTWAIGQTQQLNGATT